MQTYRARRVLRTEPSGSSWPVLVETDAGVFYTKLKGAAQAPASLVAETIVGGLADALGLPVPARVLIELLPDVCIDDPRYELRRLVRASAGLNLGFQALPEVRRFHQTDVDLVDPERASCIVWLDGLVQNPDRTMQNPNLLWSHGQLWLIDHGASLGFQHSWPRVTEQSPRAGWPAANHALSSRATDLGLVDASMAERLGRSTLESTLETVPGEWLMIENDEARRRRRAAFVAFLWKRLKSPRPFVS
jgi:hypothetical protein